MKFYGYGEDALTLWALRKRLDYILQQLDDASIIEECTIFYRPSFGRRGGAKSSQFGEFDFIILSGEKVYLGESKWDNLSKQESVSLGLRDEQKKRHEAFKFYIGRWFKDKYKDWADFQEKEKNQEKIKELNKTVPGSETLLAENLEKILEIIGEHFAGNGVPKTENVLLFFYKETEPRIEGDKEGFNILPIDYSKDLEGNFIEL